MEDVDVDAVMVELHRRVRERLRSRLVDEGGSPALDDPSLFADVEAVLRAAARTPDTARLILPELLGEPDTWRLTTSMRYRSHRGRAAASLLTFIKRRIGMPLLRWFYEYSRDNFERQRRVNHVLFACVQELAVETALLRRQLARLAGGTASESSGGPSQSHSASAPRR